jgi:hypothetical protein
MKWTQWFLVVLLVTVSAGWAYSAGTNAKAVNVPYTFTAGQPAVADQVNANFNYIEDLLDDFGVAEGSDNYDTVAPDQAKQVTSDACSTGWAVTGCECWAEGTYKDIYVTRMTANMNGTCTCGFYNAHASTSYQVHAMSICLNIP